MNEKLLALLSFYLNNKSDFLTTEDIRNFCIETNFKEEDSVSFLLAAALGLNISENNEDKNIFNLYFKSMLNKLNTKEFYSNPYYSTIKIPEKQIANWKLGYMEYKPYEMFVCDDMRFVDNKIIPQIGYFNETFRYPIVWENGREWMTITPNEIATMKDGIKKAQGAVATFGLGLGYYAFMVSQKPDVENVVIVERDKNVISLFEQEILPQFPNKNKIKIVCDDAIEYTKSLIKNSPYNYIYVDLWHDVSDGTDLYLKFKELTKNISSTEFGYWIEPTIKCYL